MCGNINSFQGGDEEAMGVVIGMLACAKHLGGRNLVYHNLLMHEMFQPRAQIERGGLACNCYKFLRSGLTSSKTVRRLRNGNGRFASETAVRWFQNQK